MVIDQKMLEQWQPYGAQLPQQPQQPVVGSWIGKKIKEGALYLWDNSLPYVRWICTLVAILGLLSCIYGYKKGKYISGGSVSIFIFVKMLDFLFKR